MYFYKCIQYKHVIIINIQVEHYNYKLIHKYNLIVEFKLGLDSTLFTIFYSPFIFFTRELLHYKGPNVKQRKNKKN